MMLRLPAHEMLLLVLATTFAMARPAVADPSLGYVYPAGGQRGTVVEVIVGGVFLDDASGAVFSAQGMRADVLDYLRPLNQGQFKLMQARLGEQRRARQEDGLVEGRRRGGEGRLNEQWTLEHEQEYQEIRGQLATFQVRSTSVSALVETVRLAVTIDPTAPLGPHVLRLRTSRGLTNPLTFVVGSLPETVEVSGRALAVAAAAQRDGPGRKAQDPDAPEVLPGVRPEDRPPGRPVPLLLPAVANGQILPGGVDLYRFHATAGQQLVAAVDARRLIPYLSDAVPGWFQPVLTLRRLDGTPLLAVDDFREQPDPVLVFTVPATGDYLLEIRDALYRGREDFVYRLTAGELPLVTSVFPLGVAIGQTSRFELAGVNLPADDLTVTGEAIGLQMVDAVAGELMANRLTLAVDDRPAVLEHEPNDTPAEAQQLTLPAIVDGRIADSRDADLFSFQAKAGDRLVAEVQARRLGSALDAVLYLLAPDGQPIAFNDDHIDPACGLLTHHADALLTATVAVAGRYQLRLVDAQQRGGADCAYRLHLRLARPDFELRITPSTINVGAGMTVPLTAYAVRRDGLEEEIAIDLAVPMPGFVLSGARIPAGSDRVDFTLTVPSNAAGRTVAIEFHGIAHSGPDELRHRALPADERTQAFAWQHLVTAPDLLVAVLDSASRGSPTTSYSTSHPLRVPVGGTASVTIDGLALPLRGTVQLEPRGLPSELSVVRVAVQRDHSEVVLRCAPDANIGTRGNLLFEVYADEEAPRGRPQQKTPRRFLAACPAIPFEIIASGGE